jgi:threonine dehydrogenase-like Zn-dependent dehydrogenase
VKELTAGTGVDAVIDAVGVDAVGAKDAPREEKARAAKELEEVAPETRPRGGSWHPGDAPSQALGWAVETVSKAGTIAIIGVYPPTARSFPIGKAMKKNVSVKMGNCNHRKYIPLLVERIRTGAIDPSRVITQQEPLDSAIEAYRQFDRREAGWLKVELQPAH